MLGPMRRAWWSVSMLLWSAAGPLAATAGAQEPPQTVTVSVVSAPRGASVEVLGRGEVGRTPIRRLELPVGEHDFVFTRRGYARQVVHATVTADGQTIGADLQRAGRVVVRADHLPARGASVRVDGMRAGRIPTTIQVAPGRRLIEVDAEGFLTFGRWVDVEESGTVTLHVRLEARPPDVGAVFVTSDVPEAQVEVDDEARGATPLLVEGLTVGEHRVVVRGPDDARHEATVTVRADAREAVHAALLPEPEPPGSVSVATQPEGAQVLMDGEPAGVTPLTLDGLTPGPHRLELSLDGYDAEERVLTVESGGRAEVAVTLSAGTPRPGRIVVTADREDAFVIVDGLSRGRAPLTLERVAPGAHTVRLQAQGAAPFETECVIRFGETCAVEAALRPPAVPLTVSARGGGRLVDGTLSIDGGEPAPLPFEGALEVGEHALEVAAAGFETHRETLTVEAGAAPIELALTLASTDAEATDASAMEAAAMEAGATADAGAAAPREPPAPYDGFVSESAAMPIPAGHAALHVGLGWPFLLGVGLDVGVIAPIDLGFAARTFGRLTEIEARGRLGTEIGDVVGLGLRLALIAGFGPDDVNAFTARLDGRFSLRPAEDVLATIWGGVDFSSDGYPFAENDSTARLPGGDRQDLIRARIGAAVGWRFAVGWSVDLRFEGALASTGGRRRLFGDVLGLGNDDTEVYGTLGVSHHW